MRLLDSDRGVAERRQLTVCFLDLVGSTELSQKLDPEELHEVYRSYQSASSAIISRYAGHIAQYLGDGILAYFGYPVAHEDDALRAVRAGLEVLSAIDDISRPSRRLSVRIGIHTGLVVVGDLGAGGSGSEQLALGEAPNLAARIQARADPNSLLISESTRRIVAGHFRLEDLGSCSLKGSSRPIQLWRVLGLGDAATRFDALTAESGLTPFVGRRNELDLIRQAWERAANGEGQAVLLRGEAGIGKSRLLGAARSVIAQWEHEHFDAECSPYDTNSPFHPVLRMLERKLSLSSQMTPEQKIERLEEFVSARGDKSDDSVRVLASLLHIPLSERYDSSDPPSRQRQRMLEVLTEIQLRAPRGGPTLVIIEDLHWADPSTLELIAALVSRQANAQLMVIGTSRPELPDLWSPAGNRLELRIEPLAPAEARGVIAGVTGAKPLPEGVQREIVERTAGIPLFVEAVTRTVVESGVLRELEDRYELIEPLPSELIPATIHDSLRGRLDLLGGHKLVAQIAAVVGQQFDCDLLEIVSRQPRAVVEAAMRRLVDLEMVSRAGVAPHWRYAFKHALIRDVAYESLLKKTRQEYHARVADALSSTAPAMGEVDPALLAHHLEHAGRLREAIPRWLQAADRAGARAALQECIGHIRRALALLEMLPPDDPERVAQEMAAQLALGPALMATRGWGSREVETACRRARELCEMTQNGEGLFAALWGLWTVPFVRGEMDRALVAANDVLRLALATDQKILHVTGHYAVGFTHYYRGEFSAALEHARQQLALFDLEAEKQFARLIQISPTVTFRSGLTMSLQLMGYPDQARQRQLELEELIEAIAIPAVTGVGLGVAMYYYLDTHDVDAIAARSDRAYALSLDAGFEFWSSSMQIYRGWARCFQGDPERGVHDMSAGLKRFIGLESGIYVPTYRFMIAEGLRLNGQLEAALESIDAGLEQLERNNERYYEAELYRLRGEILIDLGAVAEGEASLRRATRVAASQQARLLELRAANALARLLSAQGHRAEARAVLQPVYDWFTEGHDARDLQDARRILEQLTNLTENSVVPAPPP